MRQRNPERSRERILAAALGEFAAKGFAGARVADIARRAGLNKQLISHHFGGKVGLSASAALRRVKRLEEAGVIAGYVALVRARSIGLGLTAYINVRLEKQSGGDKRDPMDLFAAAVAAWPEVVECVSLTGDMDYLVKVLVAEEA